MLRLVESLNATGEIDTLVDAHFDWGCFKGKLDTSRAVISGHSMGSITTMCTLALTDKFKCASS